MWTFFSLCGLLYLYRGVSDVSDKMEGKELRDMEIKAKEVCELKVKLFGNFSLMYGEQSLLGKKTSETQFTLLMQILLYYHKTGVSREHLEELLFGDRDIKNVHHTMQSVIYNAKKRLKKAGLPDVNYVRLEKGVFYWNDEIPIDADTTKFEELYDAAEKTGDKKERLALLIEACRCYTGEFMERYASMIWAAGKARKYRNQFYDCVEKAAELLREQEDYTRLKRLGDYASGIAPFADWECLSMEALIGLGKFEDAENLYANTVDYYFKERGIQPSEKLMQMFERMENQMIHPMGMLDKIQKKLIEDDEKQGGYLCSYPVFRGIYRMVTRMMERGGQSVYLMLCTVVDSKGNPMKDGEQLDELSDRLAKAICKSIRHGDAVNRYGKGQYLILLINITLENCKIIERRIDANFLTGRQRTGVQYHVSAVQCESFYQFDRE